ncbi:hypothetical protein L4D00_08050 [Photobacterium swingsii]|uniref:hypothetical protein n=1 Tax=Photobacterium swingsii TaxID=680026 RepID=UPI001955B14B|nr:hypothetical protein [Photobacterium swingsii]
MRSDSADPAYETLEISTPLDYTTDMYKVYFEVRDHDGKAYAIIAAFVGDDRVDTITRLAHGYEVPLPIQCIPDIVRMLAEHNIAVYQVIRYAKLNQSWPSPDSH